MKTITWDIIFVVLLGIVLTIFAETDQMNLLFKMPFVTIYAAYIIGRYAGYRSEAAKRKVQP